MIPLRVERLKTENPDIRYSRRSEVLALEDVDWMDDFSSIRDQLEKHRDEISAMEPIVEIEYGGETKTELRDLILAQLPQLGGGLMLRNGISFNFDPNGAQAIVTHAREDELRAAAIAAPYIAKKGLLISGHRKHEGNNVTTLTFAGPAILSGERVHVGVAIQFTNDGRPKAVNVETESGETFKIKKVPQGLRSRTGKSQVTYLLTRGTLTSSIDDKNKSYKENLQKSRRSGETMTNLI